MMPTSPAMVISHQKAKSSVCALRGARLATSLADMYDGIADPE